MKHSDSKISALEFVDADERDVVLNKFNNTARDLPEPYSNSTIHGLFEYWATKTPDARAISYEVSPHLHFLSPFDDHRLQLSSVTEPFIE